MCVCVSVCYYEICYIPCLYVQIRCHRVLYGVFKVFVVWLSLKMLCSRVLPPFVGHRHLPCSPMTSRWTKETTITMRRVCMSSNITCTCKLGCAIDCSVHLRRGFCTIVLHCFVLILYYYGHVFFLTLFVYASI